MAAAKTDTATRSRVSDAQDESHARYVVSRAAYEGEDRKVVDNSGAISREKQADEIPAPPGSSPVRILGFRDAINAALMRNPDVVTARAAGPVADATRVVTATYPWNPSVQVQVDPFDRAEDGTSLQTRNQVIVTQTIELAHQSRFRREAAVAGWQAQHATIAQSEWNVATTAMRAYFELMYRKGLLDVAIRNADLQSQTSGIVNRRYKAGLSTATEQLTAQVTARQFQKQAALAQADYVTALNALRNVLNLPPEDLFEVDNRIDSYRWLPLSDACAFPESGDGNSNQSLSDVTENSIANRPDVAAARYNAATAQSNLDLAKANTVPNVATGPTYERDESGTLFFGVSAQMDLPVWNTGCPLVRQRAAELQQQLITLSQTRVRAELQVQAAVNRYALACELWESRREAKRPGSNESTTAVNAFEQGQATILEVLSIQDALVQEQKADLDLFHEVSQAAIDVVAALALDPDQLIQVDGIRLDCVIRQPGS
jgi:cobalt-zinc-cadmium efflux system outer membrane protein